MANSDQAVVKVLSEILGQLKYQNAILKTISQQMGTSVIENHVTVEQQDQPEPPLMSVNDISKQAHAALEAIQNLNL